MRDLLEATSRQPVDGFPATLTGTLHTAADPNPSTVESVQESAAEIHPFGIQVAASRVTAGGFQTPNLHILPRISAIGTIDQRIRSRGREAA